MGDDVQQLRTKLNSETAKIPWLELQRFYAQGNVLFVDSTLDLVEVACQFVSDNVEQFNQWKDEQKVATVSDDQARQWFATDAVLWAVVVAPWILVQLPKPD